MLRKIIKHFFKSHPDEARQEPQMNDKAALIIVDAYGEVLERTMNESRRILEAYIARLEMASQKEDRDYFFKSEDERHIVFDRSELPFSKEKIKQALIVLLNSDLDEFKKDQLKIGYMSLSNFQDVTCLDTASWEKLERKEFEELRRELAMLDY